ncbi:hypothetical protein [Enterobacter mori]|uniref:hypothetical protein n=1 Tax=Enterobacter mori TaxID=539813 RepID=UPI000D35E75B|nr:hypothetical protein [Enterobacter mori]
MEYTSVIVICYILALASYLAYLYHVKAFKMNAEPITHQPLFTAAIAIPIVSFFSFGIICWSDHSLQIDSDGFNNFLNISKLPLALLSLSLPFGVVVNNIHRTIQTDKQIKEAEKKNKIDFFYAHRKNTIEVFQNLDFNTITLPDVSLKLEFSNCYSIYRKCFQNASTRNNDFSYSEKFVSKASELWLELASKFKEEEPDNYHDLYSHIFEIEKLFDALHHHYQFKEYNHSQLYQASYAQKGEFTFYVSSKIGNEQILKEYLTAYWHAHLLIIETLEHQPSIEFKLMTIKMIMYSVSQDFKYSSYHFNSITNATQPKFDRKYLE